MDRKTVYAIQPYKVGSKNANSLAIVLPAKFVKEYNVNTSTVFTLSIDNRTKNMILQTVNQLRQIESEVKNITIPAGKSLVASSVQASSGDQ
jgi:antitoxin component of MazEF toxin-antitoxin module